MDKKYNYFYKITNIVNNKYYYGIHSTNDLNDGYMGSGVALHEAYKKYGVGNFSKEILKFFNTRTEASEYERSVVNESSIKDKNCYNLILGGDIGGTTGTATVKDSYGNIYQLPVDDDKILSGELVGITKGYVTAKDGNGLTYYVSVNDPRYLSGELVHRQTGMVNVFDENDNRFSVPVTDERFVSGIVKAMNTGKILAKDKNGRCFMVSCNDERFKTGEIEPFWVGRKHNQKSIDKLKNTFKTIQHQSGVKNSQFGTCWITKNNINKKIKKSDLDKYLQEGWKKGRIIKIKQKN